MLIKDVATVYVVDQTCAYTHDHFGDDVLYRPATRRTNKNAVGIL